ncbi:MAG: hypothetical protein FJ313_07090, partial [Gemmatimonadetes bacterium]|nr:hypothetical protein [Gemmatimonadota bacterium]
AFLLEGEAEDMPEVALRFALGNPCISSALVGFSAHEHIAAAAAACRKGPLSAAVVRRIEALWASGFRGAPQRGC